MKIIKYEGGQEDHPNMTYLIKMQDRRNIKNKYADNDIASNNNIPFEIKREEFDTH